MRRLVPFPADALGTFLGDVRNQLLLAGPVMRVPPRLWKRLRLEPADGGAGPEIVAALRVGRSTHGRVRWSLSRLPAATGVELALELDSAGPGVRAFLACGGARWLERRLADTLGHLGEVVRLAEAADKVQPVPCGRE